MKIAVLTTDLMDFKKFYEIQKNSVQKKLVQVCVLKDLTDKNYSKCVLLQGSNNVTDFVIKKAQESSLETIVFNFKDVYQQIKTN